MARRIAEQIDNGSIDLPLLRQALVQFPQLGTCRELSEPQQVAGLFEIGVVGELVDIYAAVSKHALFAIDVANFRVGGNDALKPFGSTSCGHCGHSILALVPKRFGSGAARRSPREATF